MINNTELLIIGITLAITGYTMLSITINNYIQKECKKKKKQPPFFTLSLTIQNQIYLMANVALVIGSPKTGLFTLIDNKTLLPIEGVRYSNQALGANSNPEFATFALALTDPNDPTSMNSVVGTPVAPGTGTLVITTNATYTDPGDGSAQSGSFTVTKTFVVQASADGATFDVVFP